MSFFKKSIHTIFFRSVKIIIGLFVSVIIARLLGPHNKGLLSAITLIPTFIVLFGGLGIETSNLFFTAKNKKKANQYYSNSLILSIFLSIIFIPIGLWVFYFFKSRWFVEVPFKYLLYSLILVPIGFLTKYLMGIVLGFNKIEISNKIGFFLDATNLFFLVFIVIFFKLTVVSLICLSIFIGFLNFGLLLYFLRKEIHLDLRVSPNFHYLKEFFGYGIKGHFSNILSFFNYRLDMFLVMYFRNATQLGVYTIAVAIAEKMWIIPDILSSVLFPHISTYNDKNLTSFLSRIVFTIMMIGSLLVVLVGRYFILLLYGKSYITSIYPLLFLLPGIIFLSIAKLISSDIMGRGRSDITLISSGIAGGSNLIFNLILIPPYGISGAAIASSISYTMHSLYLAYRYLKLSGQQWMRLFIINRDDIQILSDTVRRRLKR